MEKSFGMSLPQQEAGQGGRILLESRLKSKLVICQNMDKLQIVIPAQEILDRGAYAVVIRKELVGSGFWARVNDDGSISASGEDNRLRAAMRSYGFAFQEKL